MDAPELRNFHVATQNLREAMESDVPLDDLDLLSLENYIALLQITCTEWKRRNLTHPAYTAGTVHQSPDSLGKNQNDH
jgi:hypothetical protein